MTKTKAVNIRLTEDDQALLYELPGENASEKIRTAMKLCARERQTQKQLMELIAKIEALSKYQTDSHNRTTKMVKRLSDKLDRLAKPETTTKKKFWLF